MTQLIVRLTIAGFVFLLASSISVKFQPIQPGEVTSDASNSHCQREKAFFEIFEAMDTGIVTQIHNNGELFRVQVTSKWEDLTQKQKTGLNTSLHCWLNPRNPGQSQSPSKIRLVRSEKIPLGEP
jgi:hypothetical protein